MVFNLRHFKLVVLIIMMMMMIIIIIIIVITLRANTLINYPSAVSAKQNAHRTSLHDNTSNVINVRS